MIEYKHDGMTVASLHDERTGSFQYVVVDDTTKTAAIIDPVLDFDPRAGATATRNADLILDYVREKGLTVEWVLDTHPHADHFSAVPYLAGKTSGKTAIGNKVVEVQKLWRDIYCLPDLAVDGSQWDRLFADGERFRIGTLDAHVMLSPGHTLASITYVVGDAAFVHDTLMVPDSGTSRADFPGGDAHSLWCSIRAILDLPPETATYVGHDYGKDGRDVLGRSTVADQRRDNIHVHDGIDEAEFVATREKRDASLPLPDLMLAALQVNIRGGRLPDADKCGTAFLKVPLNRFGPGAS
ncbi:MBL fold metallo-hydrolase [Sphingobium sp. AR-3-1]|jgi:glyoxylase-like metal-dependent hydrolase (beta-lactamase superfamily II)|uniref:MBL fold metallo-hydrolase n=4 Tax=Sphingomonadaceae TaxID=41297 RepID=A0A7X4GIB2_9SPHN|nr:MULTISPECIES: MBL fold metallo-hydrolase [Sphingomonadaceae]ATP21938.1 MBL fold hydrolase [Sphingobium yanoikuyae]ATP21968.1 MBL fold hydrolase [Sphingobium yanoikuyae]KMW28219.1 beta-lactamase [Sphingobium yanoikuyae]MYL99161.1 MBL fold metallo-hydrolase [Novosphingobium silvae]NML12470.1 MBL fold metallo-hydrolase [Sphingobium psychrophilum]